MDLKSDLRQYRPLEDYDKTERTWLILTESAVDSRSRYHSHSVMRSPRQSHDYPREM